MTKRTWLAGALLLTLPACDTVAIDKADASPPSVVIKVRGADGQYAAASSVDLYASPVELIAVAEDKGGLHTMSLVIVDRKTDGCTVGSTVFNGVYTIQGLPEDQSVTLTEQEGKAASKMPLLMTIPTKLTCKANNGTGDVIGEDLTVRATATNWGGGTPAKTDLVVHVK